MGVPTTAFPLISVNVGVSSPNPLGRVVNHEPSVPIVAVPTMVSEASFSETVDPASPVPDTVFDPTAGVAAPEGIVDLELIVDSVGVSTERPEDVKVAPSTTQIVVGLRGAVGATKDGNAIARV